MKFSLLYSILFIITFLISCSSLNTVNSVEENKFNTSIYKNYDADSQIKYLVSNDKDNLHISLKTNHKPTIAKILRAGLTIYFDQYGKKKKNVFVKYPIGFPQDFNQVKGAKKAPSDLKSLINSTSIAAEYVYFDEQQSFTTLNPISNIQVSLTTNDQKELVYDLFIPFSKIAINGKADLFNLSIGIVTGSFNVPSNRPQLNQGEEANPRNGGIPQPGAISRNSNYSGGGARGGNQGGAPHQGYSELNTESKIWFLVGLYR
jgi:hypothetical protein